MVTLKVPFALNNSLIGGICPQVDMLAYFGGEVLSREE
jgi:hypothetical protein